MFRLCCYEVLTGFLLQHADEAGTSVRVVFGHACHDHDWGQWGAAWDSICAVAKNGVQAREVIRLAR